MLYREITAVAAVMQDVPALQRQSHREKPDVGGCPVGGAPVAGKIGADYGRRRLGKQKRKAAFVKCGGTCEKTKSEYEYYGIKDCIMASQMQDGGAKRVCLRVSRIWTHAWMPVRLMQSML